MKRWFFVLLLCNLCFGQTRLDTFLKPSDSISSPRLKLVVASQVVGYTAALVLLHQSWYKDYPQSDFHFINDASHWNQMDKMGHGFAAYHLASFNSMTLRWAGVTSETSRWVGVGTSLAFMTGIELMDGHSKEWGFSWADISANSAGAMLYIGQELLWEEQRIIPKFSFSPTPYAGARSNVLGNSIAEQVFKDYNGQTYWLSSNVASFFESKSIPKWLNVAVGYGSTGMLTAKDKITNLVFLPDDVRTRRFYLSLDVDLTKIQTNSNVLKSIFNGINVLKIPAPTLEISGQGKLSTHLIFF